MLIIGVPKEIKNSEFRVGLTERQVSKLVQKGHRVCVQKGAGEGSHIFDDVYKKAGAELLNTLEDIYQVADIIVKVKEPLELEYKLFKKDQILFTFLHLAPEPKLTEALCAKHVKSLAYETIENEKGELPLLQPMSQVAGRVGLQNGVYYLQRHVGGLGILPGGIAGAERAKVLILGGGVSGLHAAKMAVGLEAQVSILDINEKRLKFLDDFFKGKVQVLKFTKEDLLSCLKQSDLVMGCVLLTGKKAPKIITEDMVKLMKKNSVIVDVSIDQGGCVETCRPTSHQEPIYKKHDVIHYCVPNIPSAVPRTSTHALTNVTFPYLLEILEKGLEKALTENAGLKKGLNTYKGYVTYKPVAQALNREFKDFQDLRS